MQRLAIGILCLGVFGLLSVGGCPSDDGETRGAGDSGTYVEPLPSEAKSVTQKITAAKGGTVATDGVTLKFPAGALSKDLEITVKSVDKKTVPNPSGVASLVYDFGPTGTKFKKPVALTVVFSADVPKGKEPVLAFVDGDKWTTLEDSQAAADSVTATTTHFTEFAVIFVDGQQTAGACKEEDVSCGGDLVGTWKFTAGCATIPPASIFGEGSALATCKGVTIAATVDLSGSVTFAKAGTYSDTTTLASSFELTVPKACLQKQPCSALDDNKDGGAGAAKDTGTACMLAQEGSPETTKHKGTFTSDGNMLVQVETGEDAGAKSDMVEYCVTGNKLVAKLTNDDGSMLLYYATKQ